MTEKMLTTAEVAEWLSVAPISVMRWSKEGRFPKPIRIGRAVRFVKSDVEAWLENERAAA